MSRTYKDTRKWKEKIADSCNFCSCCIGGMDSQWKKLRRKSRRAQVKTALRQGKELPRFKKTNLYDFW